MKHVLATKQFADKKLLDKLVARASAFYAMAPSAYPKPLEHLTLATIFFEPSTRTRLSFETAIQNLGGRLITVENAATASSTQKGESLEDTTRTIMAYADGIVMRHPEAGAADRAATVSEVSIINAGDGANEHPSQALLDICTMARAKGTLDGLKIAMVGDLLNGRTVHSNLQLLALYNVELYFVAPSSLQMPEKYLKLLDAHNVKYHLAESFDEVIDIVDVLYMTRVQKERFPLIEDYLAVKDSFILTLPLVERMKQDAIIMHPLPRVNEIEPAVDADPRAHYFEQVKNGLYMRMALLEYVYTN